MYVGCTHRRLNVLLTFLGRVFGFQVGYERELQGVMSYVFGSTIVCDALETAKQVNAVPAEEGITVVCTPDSMIPTGRNISSRVCHAAALCPQSKRFQILRVRDIHP